MRVNSDSDYFIYQDQKVNVLLQRYIYDKGEYSDRFEFEYKKNDIFMFYNQEHSWYLLTRIICKLIDIYGVEGYKTFNKYYQQKETIEEKYIVVDGKVYKPYINDQIRSGSTIHYIIIMKMADGNSLDGIISGDMRNPFYSDVYDKEKLLNTLRQRVQAYNQKNNILPDDEHYQKNLSEEYQKIIDWYRENNIELG